MCKWFERMNELELDTSDTPLCLNSNVPFVVLHLQTTRTCLIC